MKKVLFVLVLGMMSLFVAETAFAVSFGFNHIVESGDGSSQFVNGTTGEAQLLLDVTEYGGPSQVLFTFYNNGPALSSIADIYFDDDAPLLNFTGDFFDSGIVSFSEGASPGDLPGGNSVSFSADYAFDSDPETQPNGVNPGESLGILFDYIDGNDFGSILTALNSGAMDIGLHVQGFEDGGSESFTAAPVPEPSTVILLGMGMVGLVAKGKKNLRNHRPGRYRQ